MQQTNGMTTVINQEQSDLVTSATLSAGGGQKDSIKNGKTVIITNSTANINKSKITTIISSANNSKSSSNTNTNINNNNSTTTNKNSNSTNISSNKNNNQLSNGRNDVIVTNLQHKPTTASAEANNGKTTSTSTTNATLPDARQVLKEAVDAVVNSFTKHTQGYGRGESLPFYFYASFYFIYIKLFFFFFLSYFNK